MGIFAPALTRGERVIGLGENPQLFNYHRVLKEVEARTAILLVEGVFDAMKIAQAGFPAAALMDSSLSEAQEKLLTEDFERVILMLDGDEAGRSGASEIAARLCRKMFVRIVDVGEGRQPDQLSSDEIKSLLCGCPLG
jgi:DNA primase